jgi:UDP-N-acetylmuramoyl-tripeptide--D-alanyl-D-alanine ligase
MTGSVEEIVTDSRLAKPGCLFVAIPGDRFDGHDYAVSAIEKGAVGVVVQRPVEKVDPAKTILVDNTKRAYIAVGGLHRAKFTLPIVGVTGSVGKTTTKEFTHAVCPHATIHIKTKAIKTTKWAYPRRC